MGLMLPNFYSATVLVVATTAVYLVAKVVYNLYFHPLARFPGPFAYRATRLAWLLQYNKGTLSKDMLAFHKRYGPIVRIAPDELAFNHPDAWKEIYGHKTEEFPKFQPFYHPSGHPTNIVTEPSRANHRQLRLQLAPQFSDRSMREQEPIIKKYMDLLVTRLRENAFDPNRIDASTGLQARRPLDLVAYYTWTTFDAIGDLAFGEPFGCLDRVKDDPWIKGIFDAMKKSAVIVALSYLGLDTVVLPILKRFINKGRAAHDERTAQKLRRRMELKVERPDLIEGILRKAESMDMDFTTLGSNASVLIVAGSETTSTLLSGVTYLLLRNPDVLRKLTDEVRSSFNSEEEITLLSVGKLNYMLACLNEGLRKYPPVTVGMPRFIPQGTSAVIAGEVIPAGTKVAVWQWATYHSAKYFTDPFGFHPERFLHDPRFANDKLDMLQPFSFGPRNCVGRNLAYAEMRLILAKIIYNFDMQLVDENVDWLEHKSFIVHIKPPLPVYLTPVKRA
ncbi:cytochrome P450 [Cercophora newfieldiana]|uniref:Cytochrome P450 n=1 Tax=Cercophora newfieldiana TaxID=92897 RepID=A0AA40CRY8_9PEZI|nr:cytochrome P450 [Cercophora newfieldiana]